MKKHTRHRYRTNIIICENFVVREQVNGRQDSSFTWYYFYYLYFHKNTREMLGTWKRHRKLPAKGSNPTNQRFGPPCEALTLCRLESWRNTKEKEPNAFNAISLEAKLSFGRRENTTWKFVEFQRFRGNSNDLRQDRRARAPAGFERDRPAGESTDLQATNYVTTRR